MNNTNGRKNDTVHLNINRNFASFEKPLSKRVADSEDAGLAWLVLIICGILGLIIKLMI